MSAPFFIYIIAENLNVNEVAHNEVSKWAFGSHCLCANNLTIWCALSPMQFMKCTSCNVWALLTYSIPWQTASAIIHFKS